MNSLSKDSKPELKDGKPESKDSKPESEDSQTRRVPKALYIWDGVHFECQVCQAMFGVSSGMKQYARAQTPGEHHPGSSRLTRLARVQGEAHPAHLLKRRQLGERE